jgi:hypothetical protein
MFEGRSRDLRSGDPVATEGIPRPRCLVGPQEHARLDDEMKVRLADYPQLQLIAWNRRSQVEIDGQEAFALYEANWRFVDPQTLVPQERDLIRELMSAFGLGLLNV